ncbi:sulfite reductase (NADPH) flavoprotein alpha-component [Sphingobium jiangsuense]|uniref:NADPH--hemoprotein reductase n=2 Tax=Sphingobium jiangsuense TaxID=870476 RepID=A0A7W6BKJ4_9SPHN|nr:NADPH cytochrome P450 oxidoreductase family protein [Sphingobium jiangsuense]MBB3926732.1 sulfite reductase (NADPH) flavoprotein alpha-component [Sphingobium jiangsuense]
MGEAPFRLNADPAAWAIAAMLVAAWALFTLWMLRKRAPVPVGAARNLVVHASQTGQATDIAEQTQLRIEASGEPCALVEANQLTPAMIAQADRLFFVASTTGEGEAPDNARRFADRLLAEDADLATKQVAVLALGDRRYPAFCGFGRSIDAWARRSGADMLFTLVEVDDLARADLAAWDARLTGAGYPRRTGPAPETAQRWRVASRERVAEPVRNPQGGLCSDGLYRIALRPPEGPPPLWEVGDLFELRTPGGHVRDYSIASLPDARPEACEIVLFVRRVVDKGVVGHGSGHLTDAEAGATTVMGRIRTHRSFHPPTGAGPLLAIGAGSGWAGLRPHLLLAMGRGQRCALIFGERAGEEHGPLLAEMRQWQVDRRLERLGFALSQGGGNGPYVQHVIARWGDDIRAFLGGEGRILLCGHMAMGEQCLTALSGLLGRDWIDSALEDGRLRRDFY